MDFYFKAQMSKMVVLNFSSTNAFIDVLSTEQGAVHVGPIRHATQLERTPTSTLWQTESYAVGTYVVLTDRTRKEDTEGALPVAFLTPFGAREQRVRQLFISATV